MDTTTNPGGLTGALSQFSAVHAEVGSVLLTGKLGVDQVAELLYELGTDGQEHFFISAHVIAPITPAPLYRELSLEEVQSLLTALRAEEQHPPAGLDVTVLRTFVHLLSQGVGQQPSTRFANARFGEVARDASGAIVGHLGLGVDVVGTIHDAHGFVTAEQHVVPLPPRPFRRLSAADKASLAAALQQFIDTAQPPANQLWVEVLHDLRK